jgi:hypothetical protein
MKHNFKDKYDLNPLEGSMISKWHFVYNGARFPYYIWKLYHSGSEHDISCSLYHALVHNQKIENMMSS